MTSTVNFDQLADPFRGELLGYCYRMLGSIEDAEDQVQETLLRAWRAYGDFEGRSSLRTWLFRIATNACLRALETRGKRPLPSGLGEPAEDPEGPLAPLATEIPWLQPIPDSLVTGGLADPAAVVTARASLRLALIAALQYLPPRQRAVLILRDVLGWHAAEVAALLEISTTAANSVLQRARAQLAHVTPAEEDLREPADLADRALLDRYARAFETADIAALTELLRADATFEMPPQPRWIRGRDRIARFLRSRVLTEAGKFVLVRTSANGIGAFAAYERTAGSMYIAHGIQVPTTDGALLTGIVSFNDAHLVAKFGLPGELTSAPGFVHANRHDNA
ncbi:MAG TPA: sigma-70 family RNA polymerase sigma factor [Streptosporangiaceae bacterium]|nr:sigma-70 family RNA polymerase sigma factor [Streptosporangiaceae bacterium]